ncbi:hypothetical protein N0V90_011217 [Kalmusia sp. IMI 367209]|nr:hypothetical protein N0V90_011217 [Kalmusia sp. IMI 367209]
MACLPPTPLHEFDIQAEKKVSTKKTSPTRKNIRASTVSNDEDSNENNEEEEEESSSPFHCLFCPETFTLDDVGLISNLLHMRTTHYFSIPHSETVLDMQSFVGYLATEIRTWHECLYCGATKDSTVSIQSHMRDKGHCVLNLDREPELRDFWETLEWLDGNDDTAQVNERAIHLSETEMRFASGKVIASRHTTPSSRRPPRNRSPAASTKLALPADSENAETLPPRLAPQASSNRRLARHEEMALAGISVQQRQTLVLAEKKAQRSEAVARRAREWVYARGANVQEFDQLDTKGKWGKQNHKLLPR